MSLEIKMTFGNQRYSCHNFYKPTNAEMSNFTSDSLEFSLDKSSIKKISFKIALASRKRGV